MNDLEQSIISLTTNFGEFIEVVIKHRYNLSKPKDGSHDATSGVDRVEIKSSRLVIKESVECATHLERILNNKKRLVRGDELCVKRSNACNIQQIKPYCFDVMYFCYFIHEGLMVYKVRSSDVPNIKGYTDKQHKGNVGEGQFHTTSKNIDKHDHLFHELIPLDEIVEIWKTEL